ncbi:hypothetical protein, unlikely [Trypanosoma congolense IL3000]|uniref:Uncharacterized protein n=1 Tax=Trypanosoma congolense (strain IL3000) TaxID=1068625 RepID=F9WHN0_TRYCI|nr:hypothetical protein, unlikely [Trypanosoma congolense IL3000]
MVATPYFFEIYSDNFLFTERSIYTFLILQPAQIFLSLVSPSTQTEDRRGKAVFWRWHPFRVTRAFCVTANFTSSPFDFLKCFGKSEMLTYCALSFSPKDISSTFLFSFFSSFSSLRQSLLPAKVCHTDVVAPITLQSISK